MGHFAFYWICIIIKQAIQMWVICKISLCFLCSLCPSLFLSCLISSPSHTFFPPQHVDLVPYSTLFDGEIDDNVSVTERTGTKHRSGRGSSVGKRREGEQWGVQHLNCLFISSHCINYTDRAHKWVCWVCLCLCGGWGWNRKTIRNYWY